MKRIRRPNGSPTNPAISYRMAPEVMTMLEELAAKNGVSKTQQMVNLIKGSHARTKT
jgi:hypothetical protein